MMQQYTTRKTTNDATIILQERQLMITILLLHNNTTRKTTNDATIILQERQHNVEPHATTRLLFN